VATYYDVPASYGTIALGIAAAEAVGPAGGIAVVRIAAGTYTTWNHSFAINWNNTAYLSIESASGANDVTIDYSAQADAGLNGFTSNSKRFIRFAHLTIKGNGAANGADGIEGGYFSRYTDIIIWNCRNGWGGGLIIGCWFADCVAYNCTGANGYGFNTNIENTFVRCRAYSCGYGFALSANTRLVECGAYGNSVDGVYINTSSNYRGRCILINCTLALNTGNGVYFATSSNSFELLLRNCIIRKNGAYGIRLGLVNSGLLPVVGDSDYNCYSANVSGILYDGTTTVTTLAGMQTYTSQDAHSTVANPLLTNEGAGTEDVHLLAGSPCANAGIGAPSATDGFGVAWPDIYHPAIGIDGSQDIVCTPAPAAVLVGSYTMASGLRAAGTFDEAARNTVPDLALIPSPATGGPATWKQLNVNRDGTLDLTAWEAARNTSPGEANVVKAVTWKLQNVTKTGTFDEAARNVDPTVAKVILGTAYKILNTDKVGTYSAVPPSGPPTLGGLTLDLATGAVVAPWTPADAGDTGLLLLRLLGAASWTVADTDTALTLHADLAALPHGVYEFLVVERTAAGIYAAAPSGIARRAWVGGDDPLTVLLGEIQALLQADADLAAYLEVPAEWPDHVLLGIDERRLPPRNNLRPPYIEVDVAGDLNAGVTWESADETVRILFRFTVGADEASYAATYRMARLVCAALRQGLGVPEQYCTLALGNEVRRGRYWRLDWTAEFPLRVERRTLG